MIVVVCCYFVVFVFFVLFYDVMLLSKPEAGKHTKNGGQKVEQLPVAIKGGSYVCNS